MWRCTGRGLHGLAHHVQLRPQIITGCARKHVTCSAQRGAGGIRSAAGLPLHSNKGEGRNRGSGTVSAAEEPEEERMSKKEAPSGESPNSSSSDDMTERLRSILPGPPPPPSEEALKLQLLMELTG